MKKIINILAIILLLSNFGCTSSFDDINKDPDAYSEVPFTNILGNVIRRSTNQYYDDLDIAQFAGYVCKIRYIDEYNNLIPTNNKYGNRWFESYWGHVQLQDILDKTEDQPEGNKNMRNVCLFMQNYLMFLVLDSFGDIPYSEAFKGAPENGGKLSSKYDKESIIYPQILANLEYVANSWAEGYGEDELGKGDFLFEGDINKWHKLCNSLRLRIALRISKVYPESKNIIETIFANSDRYPIITNCDENAYFWWQGTGVYYERYYNDFTNRDDHGMSKIFIDHLITNEDPRLSVIAKPAESDNTYRGSENCPLVAPIFANISRIGVLYREDPAGFSPIFRACENYFIMAEAALNGWNVPLSAKDAYEKAVTLSMTDNGISESNADDYLSKKGKWDGTYERLYNEYWVALFKQNLEGWSLYRRTGYPKAIFTAVAADNKTPQYPGVNTPYSGIHNDVPFRMPYPNNQFSYNREAVEEASIGIVDYVWGKQLWWDTRENVY